MCKDTHISVSHIYWFMKNIDITVQWYHHRLLKKVLSPLNNVAKFCNPHTGIMTRAYTQTRWHSTMTHHRPRQEIARSQSTQTKDVCMYVYTYVCVFSLFVEATGITERSPKRVAVSELKSFSDEISGRLSPREVSEMPVLTRVCSPATLPRLKKFRFRPFDGELCSLLICKRIHKLDNLLIYN